MNFRTTFFVPLFLLASVYADAQKPFTEGVIVYNVTLQSTDNKTYTGIYTFTIKGNEIKKELRLNNGYQDVVLLDCGANTVYSLQSKYGRKYAIQLNMDDIIKEQAQFTGFTLNNEEVNSKNFGNIPACKGTIKYKNGSSAEIYYTREWSPVQGITYDRFPSPKFLPLYFSYKDEHGLVMLFEINTIEATPVENAVFRIPHDYKMISYKEYKELSK